MQAAYESGNVIPCLIDFGKIMRSQGPVLFHDTGRGLHTGVLQLLDQFFKSFTCCIIFGIEFFSRCVFDSCFVVDNPSCLDADRETVYNAVNINCLCRILYPVLVAQIHSVIRCEGIDVFCIDHGKRVRLIGGISGGHMRCDCIT